MRNNQLFQLTFLILAFVAASCQDREPLSWESEIFLPLVDDEFGWSNFVEDSLLELGLDGEPALLVLDQTINLSNDDFAPALPDTTIVDVVAFGAVPVPVPVPTDVPFVDQSEEMELSSIGAGSDMYLRETLLSNGTLRFSIQSSIEGILDFSYSLPCATVNGEEVAVDLSIPAAVDGVYGYAEAEVDLTDAVFDLRGESGVEYNILRTQFSALGSLENDSTIYATNLDSIWINIEFIELQVQTAEGYFGNMTAQFGESIDVLDTIPVPNPILDLQDGVAKITFNNTLGADVRLSFDSLSMDGSNIIHPSFFGVHDITRSIWEDGDLVQMNSGEIDLAEPGSNFFDLLELLPENIHLVGDLELNPLGDVTLGHDYLDMDYVPTMDLEFSVPMRIGASGIVLEESYEVEPMDFTNFEGRLLIDLWSDFPVNVGADVNYAVNDSLGTVEVVEAEIAAGNAVLGIISHSFIEIPFDQTMVESGGTVDVVVDIHTDGAVEFTGTETIKVKVRVEGTQLIAE
jgi:hypothetical protein